MQKIRIGNDIRFNITLKGQRAYDQSNVKQLRCYLINTEYENKKDDCCSCMNEYHLHACGCPSYHVMPHNCCFRPVFPPLPMYRPIEQQKPCKPCGIDFVDPNAPEDCKYLAPSKMTSKQNGAIVYFPAEDQRMLGIYKLVVVIVIFEPGWGRTNLRTYTIDYGDVVQLVDDDQAVSGDITIDVDTDTMQYSNIVDIKVVNTELYMASGERLNLGDLDRRSHYYKIQVELENGSIVTYNPYNWPYEKLRFSSSSEDNVSVDAELGILRTSDNATSKTTITVRATNSDLSKQFDVNIIAGDCDYIGFLPVRPFASASENDALNGFDRQDDSYEEPDQELATLIGAKNVDLSKLLKVKDLSTPVTVKNTVDGQYLWIVTHQPIYMAAEANSSIPSGFATYIPLTRPQFVSGESLYYYACPNPIKADKNSNGSNIYVKYK